MAVARALRRVLRIRDLEEEQGRLALESALAGLRRLEHARASAVERDRRGRRLVEASAHTGELPDRLAGLEETRTAERLALALAPMIVEAQQEVTALREQYLAKRVERRQAETLIREAEVRDAEEAGRRGQQALDDWFGNRLHGAELGARPAHPAGFAKGTRAVAEEDPGPAQET